MGTITSVESIKDIEQVLPDELLDIGLKIRTSLNVLENKLGAHFPNIDNVTALPHLVLQQALKNYFGRLSEELKLQKMLESGVTSASPDSFPFSNAPSFLNYLSGFGKVGRSLYIDQSRTEQRAGIFLRGENTEAKLLGLLSARDSPKQIEYSGYIPISPQQSKLFTTPVYHLSSPPSIEGINFAFVRLFAEKEDKKFERVDAYANKGIEFP